MLLQSEILILDEKYDLANNLLDHIEKSNPLMKKLLYKGLVLLQKKVNINYQLNIYIKL